MPDIASRPEAKCQMKQKLGVGWDGMPATQFHAILQLAVVDSLKSMANAGDW